MPITSTDGVQQIVNGYISDTIYESINILDVMDIERQSAVQSITIRVTQPFTTGTVTVGEQGDPDKYADEDNFDMTSIGTYISRVPTYRDDFNEGKLKLFYNNLTGSGEFTVLAVVA